MMVTFDSSSSIGSLLTGFLTGELVGEVASLHTLEAGVGGYQLGGDCGDGTP